MPQPKKISAYQMYDFSFILKQNQDWIKEYWEKLDGDKNYIGMIENMRESVNLKHKASVDRNKYLTDDKNVPKQDVITDKDKEHPDEISQFALDKVSIYVAAKQTLAKRPWYRFLLHPIDSYRESKALNNLKNEITSGMYGITDKMLDSVDEFANSNISNSDGDRDIWNSIDEKGQIQAELMNIDLNDTKNLDKRAIEHIEKYNPDFTKQHEKEQYDKTHVKPSRQQVPDEDDEGFELEKDDEPKKQKETTESLQERLKNEKGIGNKVNDGPKSNTNDKKQNKELNIEDFAIE